MSKLGCINGVHRSKEYPVAASQKFNRTGGAFVYLDGSGHVTLALSATATLFGYAVVPQGIGSGLGTDAAVWQSSATAGADRIPVITDLNAEFLVPTAGAVTAAMAGNAVDIVGVNDGTQQTCNEAAGSTDVLIIQGRGMDLAGATTTSFAVVKRNPAKNQAD